MKSLTGLIGVATAVLLLGLTPGRAQGLADASGGLSAAGLGVGVATGAPTSASDPVQTESSGSGYGGATVLSDSFGGAVWLGLGSAYGTQVCGPTGGAAVPTSSAPLGSTVYVVISSAGIPIGSTVLACSPGPGGAVAPPPPPPPPSADQVWAAATGWEPLVSSGIEVNPQTLGLTGLASWFWLSNPTTSLPPLTVSIAGYSVTASASIASYTWTFGDGDSATAYGPGSSSAPAAVYTYQQKGSYQVSVIAHYVGSYTFVGNGLSPQTVPLNVDVTMGTLTYGVQEARSVLVDPGGSSQ